ncbi:MAG: DUF11 domain-containing protein [Desulfuromonadales bacterium]|nr:DUF11 domain-containing protein [Desulfuromonadales bacterium]
MKQLRNSSMTAVKTVFGSLALLACLTFALPQAAQAAGTSGNATIYNTVKVTYQSGTNTLFATANVSVTVNTVTVLPTITVPTGQTVAAGASVTYDYILKSNANGLDTYTTSALSNAPTSISAATATSVTASVQLWGGIALGSGAGTITVPFNTTAGLSAGTSTVQIGANKYTVSTITAGTAASTDGSGNLVAEGPTTLTLAVIGASPAITAGSVTAGTQVGEFKNTALTAALTAGTPTTAGTDGSYVTNFVITTGALPSALSTLAAATSVTTTVSSPRVTITKTANVANASPGGTITYTITVTNTHPTASANAVTVIDPVPAYTTYVANSTRLNTITVAGDGGSSPLVGGGLLVDNDAGRTGGVAASGILPALGVATIIFNVTVQ